LAGVVAIAVRHHVSYPLFDERFQRTAETLQIVGGIILISFGVLALIFLR